MQALLAFRHRANTIDLGPVTGPIQNYLVKDNLLISITNLDNSIVENNTADQGPVTGPIQIYLVNAISFVCVEVLRSSQPNGVMSSVVSLPNHTFTEQD